MLKARQMTREELVKELIAGVTGSAVDWAGIYTSLRALPASIDDAERDFGSGIYDRMLNDPAVGSSVDALIVSILSEGPRLEIRIPSPSAAAKADPELEAKYARAVEIRDWLDRMFDRLQAPIESILAELVEFFVYGHVVAEQSYGLDGGQLALKVLRPKARSSYRFVVNAYGDCVGLVGQRLGASAAPAVSVTGGQVPTDLLIPREKFLVLTYRGRGGDPRGRSLLRRAYNPWYLKLQAWPEYLKALATFGTPSLLGTLGPDATSEEVADAVTGAVSTLSAAEALLAKLVAFKNGTAVVVPNGTEVEPITVQGNGEIYPKAIDVFNREIARAILIAIRSTMEAEHSSKADSETAQDLLGAFAQTIRRMMEIGIYRDVILPVVRYNLGDEVADSDVVPFLSLSELSREDVIERGNMVANLARSGFVHSSQYPGIDSQLGLPERDYEAQQAEDEERREREAELASRIYGSGGAALTPGEPVEE